jgi:hypothetical protein
MDTLVTFFSTYIFLLSALYFLFWSVLFLVSFRGHRDIQKRIFVTSLLPMVVFPFVELITLADWWSPVFVWGTFLHVEDILFGFGITGTTLGIYFWVSRDVRVQIERQAAFSRLYASTLLVAPVLVTFVPFYFFHVSSFYTGTLSMILLSICVFVRVPAMISPAFITGILLTLIILPGYFLATYLHPGWIQEYWKLTGWPGYPFLMIPLGEYVYYFLSGLFLPAFMELLFAKRSVTDRHHIIAGGQPT